MNVSAILHDKGSDVVTLTADATIREAAKLLAKYGVGSVVILDDAKHVKGIVSEGDIVREVAKRGSDSLNESVANCMTTSVMTCKKSDTVAYLMGQMTRHRFRHMPVVEKNMLLGIVSIGDVVKSRIAETEMEATAMRAYIATG